MARRGGGRRTYVRDANGRFASTPGGGGGSKRPKARMAQRGPNRLTRDNAGKITSQGGNGATVRGGRLRTAGGNLRGRVLAKGPKQSVAGTIVKPKGLKPGALAERGGKAAPTAAQFSVLSARAKEKAARARRRAASRFKQAGEQDRAAIKQARSTKTAGSRKKANKALRSAMVMQRAVRVLSGQITPTATRRPLATRIY